MRRNSFTRVICATLAVVFLVGFSPRFITMADNTIDIGSDAGGQQAYSFNDSDEINSDAGERQDGSFNDSDEISSDAGGQQDGSSNDSDGIGSDAGGQQDGSSNDSERDLDPLSAFLGRALSSPAPSPETSTSIDFIVKVWGYNSPDDDSPHLLQGATVQIFDDDMLLLGEDTTAEDGTVAFNDLVYSGLTYNILVSHPDYQPDLPNPFAAPYSDPGSMELSLFRKQSPELTLEIDGNPVNTSYNIALSDRITVLDVSQVSGVSTAPPQFSSSDSSVVSIDENTGEIMTLKKGTATITVRVEETDYCIGEEKQFDLSIQYGSPFPGSHTLSADEQNGWHRSDVIITPTSPSATYKISYSPDPYGDHWDDTISFSTEGSYLIGDIVFYCKDEATGVVYQATNTEIIQLDKTKPANMTIAYNDQNLVQDVLINALSFGFFQQKVEVVLSATDPYSKIKTFHYYFQDETEAVIPGTENQIEFDTSEPDITRSHTFEVASDFRGELVFTAVDDAGHEEEKRDNRTIVLDNTPPGMIIKYQTDVGGGPVIRDSGLDVAAQAGSGTRYYYRSPVDVQFTLNEANFFEGQSYNTGDFVNEVAIKVIRTDSDGVQHQTTYVPYHTGDADKASLVWNSAGDVHEASLQLDADGDYEILVSYTDFSGNQMTYDYSQMTYQEYTLNGLTIDTVNPGITVAYSPAEPSANGFYFNQSRQAVIRIQEHNFRPQDVAIVVQALDLNGSPIQLNDDLNAKLADPDLWTPVGGNIYEATLPFTKDARYSLDVSCTDLAGRTSGYPADPADGPEKFVVDQTKPDILSITYDRAPLNSTPSHFYQSAVTLTVTAQDSVAGIDYFTYRLLGDNGYSGPYRVAVSSYDHGIATAVLPPISPQFRGRVEIIAVDMASNNQTRMNDHEIVVDNIAPACRVEFKPVKEWNNQLYYSGEAVATIRITEANFFEEDVKIVIEDFDNSTSWTESPDEWKQQGNTWVSTVKIGAKKNHDNDGEYQIKISYTDRSNNRMADYQSDVIVIDTTKPVLKVTYSPGKMIQEIEERKYYNQKQEIMIRVTERNFNCEDVIVDIKATDVTGEEVEIPDYSEYLEDDSNWSHQKDVHTIVLQISKSANYTFDIAYSDLAFIGADKYPQDLFTVDTVDPVNASITYSPGVLHTILQNISFGFYKAPVTVNIVAEDATSGIYEFKVGYTRSDGASNINLDELNMALKAEDIQYTNERKTARMSCRLPPDAVEQLRGSVQFIAVDYAFNQLSFQDKNQIIVDSMHPSIQVSLTEPAMERDGISYYNTNVNATIQINEANFFQDDVEIQLMRQGGELIQLSASNWVQSGDIWTTSLALNPSIGFGEDAQYLLMVNYTDKSSNTAEQYVSNAMIMDTVPPQISISGISHERAYNQDTIGFHIETADPNMNPDSFKPVLTVVRQDADGKYRSEEVNPGNFHIVDQGRAYAYTVPNLEIDGIYYLTCEASDLAGNVSQSMMSSDDGKEYYEIQFSVNREGSTFAVDSVFQRILQQYYFNSVDQDIVITEVNVDPLEESVVTLNGRNLVKKTEYEVAESNNGSSWFQYAYIVKQMLFQEEGEYSIVIASTDKTGSKAYSDIKGLELNFVIDKTSPKIVASGVESGGRYQVDSQQASISVTDDGGRLESVKIAIKAKDGTVLNTPYNLSGNELRDYLEQATTPFIFQIPGGSGLEVLVECIDVAGNIAVEAYSDITVSTQWGVVHRGRFNIILIGAIAAVCALGFAAIKIVSKKRRVYVQS